MNNKEKIVKLLNIKEINKNQYIIFNEFLIKHEKIKSDKNCK